MRINAEQVMAIQKLRCGAVHGENMIAHKMAVIMMAKYNFFIYERLKDVNIRVYFRAKLKKIIFASKL